MLYLIKRYLKITVTNAGAFSMCGFLSAGCVGVIKIEQDTFFWISPAQLCCVTQKEVTTQFCQFVKAFAISLIYSTSRQFHCSITVKVLQPQNNKRIFCSHFTSLSRIGFTFEKQQYMTLNTYYHISDQQRLGKVSLNSKV